MSAPRQPLPDWRENTITSFPAIGINTPDPSALACKCGMPGCPDGIPLPAPGDPRLVLSCAPGVTSRMWRTRISEGAYDDIPKLHDAAHAKTHMPALDTQRAIHVELAARKHDIGAMFARNQALLSDTVIGDGLRDLAGRLEVRLLQMEADRAARTAAA